MGKIFKDVTELIGRSPIVEITNIADGVQGRVLVKLERSNPGGSVKDRVALGMINAAERSGALCPGGTIIEPTSGNTGVGLAMVAAARGYRAIIVMPETMSVERRKLIAAYGAELVLTPGSEGMKGSLAKANELLAATPGAIIPQQFANPANPEAHYATTGPEIWEDTEGGVDVLVSAVGTGGTVSGTSRALKEYNPELYTVAVEAAGSPVLSGGVAGPHRIQGISPGFVADNYDSAYVDEVLPVADEDAFATMRLLARKAGILVGISSGAAAYAALEVARRGESAGKTIVAVLPDTGERYLSML